MVHGLRVLVRPACASTALSRLTLLSHSRLRQLPGRRLSFSGSTVGMVQAATPELSSGGNGTALRESQRRFTSRSTASFFGLAKGVLPPPPRQVEEDEEEEDVEEDEGGKREAAGSGLDHQSGPRERATGCATAPSHGPLAASAASAAAAADRDDVTLNTRAAMNELADLFCSPGSDSISPSPPLRSARAAARSPRMGSGSGSCSKSLAASGGADVRGRAPAFAVFIDALPAQQHPAAPTAPPVAAASPAALMPSLAPEPLSGHMASVRVRAPVQHAATHVLVPVRAVESGTGSDAEADGEGGGSLLENKENSAVTMGAEVGPGPTSAAGAAGALRISRTLLGEIPELAGGAASGYFEVEFEHLYEEEDEPRETQAPRAAAEDFYTDPACAVGVDAQTRQQVAGAPSSFVVFSDAAFSAPGAAAPPSVVAAASAAAAAAAAAVAAAADCEGHVDEPAPLSAIKELSPHAERSSFSRRTSGRPPRSQSPSLALSGADDYSLFAARPPCLDDDEDVSVTLRDPAGFTAGSRTQGRGVSAGGELLDRTCGTADLGSLLRQLELL